MGKFMLMVGKMRGAGGEEAEGLAAEVVFVGAADAGEEGMVVVRLPRESGHGQGKGDFHFVGVDIGDTLQVDDIEFLASNKRAEGACLEGELAGKGNMGTELQEVGITEFFEVGLHLARKIDAERGAQGGAVGILCRQVQTGR